MQSDATPAGGTLSDLWMLRPASGPPLHLVGPLHIQFYLPCTRLAFTLYEKNMLFKEAIKEVIGV